MSGQATEGAVEFGAVDFAEGLAHFRAGRFDAAAATFREIFVAQPDDRNIALVLATCEYRIGRLDDAIGVLEQHTRHTPPGAPLDGRVAFDLGFFYFRRKDYREAVLHLKSVPAGDVQFPRAQRFLIEASIRNGDTDAAGEYLASAAPDLLPKHEHLFLVALRSERIGQFESSQRAFDSCAAEAPGEPQYRLGVARMRLALGDVAGAMDAFSTASNITRQALYDQAIASGRLWVRRTRLDLLAQQFDYLVAEAHGAAEHSDVPGALATLHAGAAEAGGGVWLTGTSLQVLAPALLLVSRVPDGGRRLGSTLRPNIDWQSVKADLKRDGVAVIDELLAQETLTKIRAHIHGSTIWFNDQFARGYVSAVLGEGLESPALLATSVELRERLRELLDRHPLATAWAFRYGPDVKGVDAHADFSRFTVNLWIAPDAGNLDPETGGMVFYDARAEVGAGFDQYNASSKWIDSALAERRVTHRVKHRCNRAVVFESEIFHASDDIRFRTEFINQRINITFGFGYR